MSKSIKLLSLGLAIWSLPAFAAPIAPPYEVINAKDGQVITLDGFIEEKGEWLIYTSQKARKLKLVFPYCMSAVPIPERGVDLSGSKKFSVTGTVVSVAQDKAKDGISTTVRAGDHQVNDWCLGDKVLIVSRLEAAR